MTLNDIKAQDSACLMPTYGRFDIAIDHGHGATAVDTDGCEYIDFGSGIGVNSLGYCDEGWVAAVSRQAAALQHISNLYYSPVQTAFAAQLCEITGMGRAFLCNSGAEANECAIKLARKHSFDTRGEGHSTIIGLRNSFHGRTLTTLSATGQDVFHQYFFPFTEGFVFAEPGDLDSLSALADDTCCAVMLECVQGEGGVVALDFDYLRAVQSLCRERGLLLIIDEVQTGAGRTGKFLACEHAGLRPDIVTMAKGLGGGLPVGACLCTQALSDVMSSGMHGSTFGGNPVVCAAGQYVLSRVTAPSFLSEVAAKGDELRRRIEQMPNVREVRGLGMMIGIVPENGSSREIAEACLKEGLLILTAKTLLRLLPPLTLTQQEMDKGLTILENVMGNYAG